ncbi:MAG: hypothetical protein AB1861_29560 [Cyanobacteriota bacterium]
MERNKILIATKTYPSISTKYKETVCTAGILLDDDENPKGWIRIYPIRFRELEVDKKFPRWSIISARIEKNDKDARPESYRIDDDSISVLRKVGTENNWEKIKSFIFPFQFDSINSIKEQNKTLGLIKPKNISKYFCKPVEREWNDKQQAVQDQLELLDLLEPSNPLSILEKIPYKFGYEFTDNDDVKHKYTITDWEIMQLYRNCRERSKLADLYSKENEALEKVRQKLESSFMYDKEIYFIVGNLKKHPQNFMIIGLVYPPIVKYEQLSFF